MVIAQPIIFRVRIIDKYKIIDLLGLFKLI